MFTDVTAAPRFAAESARNLDARPVAGDVFTLDGDLCRVQSVEFVSSPAGIPAVEMRVWHDVVKAEASVFFYLSPAAAAGRVA